MAGRSILTIAIEAPPDEVMAVIADMETYPEWVPEYKKVEVLRADSAGRITRARMVVEAAIIKGPHVLEFLWAPNGKELSWTLTQSNTVRSLVGRYTLIPKDYGTEVSYQLTIDLRVSVPGIIKRRAERAVIDTALKALKALVESLG